MSLNRGKTNRRNTDGQNVPFKRRRNEKMAEAKGIDRKQRENLADSLIIIGNLRKSPGFQAHKIEYVHRE